jgi:hypothetical protein
MSRELERLAANLQERAIRAEGGCLVYPTEFRVIYDGKLHVAAHRLAWTLANGPIPAGMLVRPVCGTWRCAEPSHLALEGRREHADRVLRPDGPPTVCPSGHDLTDSGSVYVWRGRRRCLTCIRERRRSHQRAKQAA